jgi:biopolymer transport protein ExbD
LIGDGYQIDAKAEAVKVEQLEQQLKAIVSGGKAKAVIILPQEGVTHQQVVTLIGISQRSGLKYLSIVDE